MRKAKLIWISALLAFLILTFFVHADIGPKPVVHIKIYPLVGPFDAQILGCYNPSHQIITEINSSATGITIVSPLGLSSALLAINQFDSVRNCYWQVDGAWKLGCTSQDCTFDYFIPNQFRLAVYTQGAVYISDVMTRPNSLNSYFIVDLLNSSVVGPFFQYELIIFVLAAGVTIVVELLVGLVWLHRRKAKLRRAAAVIFIANIISLLIVWFGLAQLTVIYALTLLVSELFAILFEGIVYFFALKEIFNKFKNAVFFSFILNAASLLVGFLISLLLPLPFV